MYKKPLLFTLLLTLQSQAIDLNSSNEIIMNATTATEEIQKELQKVINLPSVTTPLVENNQTTINEVEVPSTNLIMTTEENLRTNLVTMGEEKNDTNEIANPTIKSVLLIEQNLSSDLETIIEEKNDSKSLNKETFDMSKGSLERGEKIYKEHLKDICETKKSELSEHYSQEEWEAFADEGKFENTIFEICPQIEPSYNKAWSADLYQFYYQNARDHEEIPEC